jgi:hypothetical protein
MHPLFTTVVNSFAPLGKNFAEIFWNSPEFETREPHPKNVAHHEARLSPASPGACNQKFRMPNKRQNKRSQGFHPLSLDPIDFMKEMGYLI